MLNWIVPCRRAAVVQQGPHRWAFQQWIMELLSNRSKIMEWYGIADDAAYQRGIQTLRTAYFTPPEEREYDCPMEPCPAGEEPMYFWPRLWKGPLRVVWEELANESGDLPAVPSQVYSRGMVYGQTLPLTSIWDDSQWIIQTYWYPYTRARALALRRHAAINYPKPASAGLRDGMPLTPGWACVSCPGFLTHFMLDSRQGTWEGSGTRYLCDDSFPESEHVSCFIDLGTRYDCNVVNGSLLRFSSRTVGSSGIESEDDIVVVGYDMPSGGGHNVVLLKLRSPDLRIQNGQHLTSKGFISAYDPMTGADIGGGQAGRYLQLNAGGGFTPQTEEVEAEDGSSTTIQLIRQNAIFTTLTSNAQPAYHPDRHAHAYQVNLAAGFDAENIANAMKGAPYPGIAIHPMTGERVPGFFADRAVPFPTMRECDDHRGFPRFQGTGGSCSLSAPNFRGSIELDGFKRSIHYDDQFFPGDVVEFPLALFLYVCGKSTYDGFQFNPNGSFLLGNAVTAPIDGSPELHDNLIAMRFQLFLDLAQGAFYCDEHVGRSQRSGARRYPAEGEVQTGELPGLEEVFGAEEAPAPEGEPA